MTRKNLSKTLMIFAFTLMFQIVNAQGNYYYSTAQQSDRTTVVAGDKFNKIPSITKSIQYDEAVSHIDSFVKKCETKSVYIFSEDYRNLNLDIVTPRGKYLVEIQKSKTGKEDYLIIDKLNLDNSKILLAQDRNFDGFQKPTINEYTYFQSGSRLNNMVEEITSIDKNVLSEIDRKYVGVILYLKEIIDQP